MTDNPDGGLAVKFFTKPVEHKSKSREAGRPIFEDREYISIRFPGDSKRELCAPAHERHLNPNTKEETTYAMRFNSIYQAFKDGLDGFVEGTPISELPFLTESRRSELRALSIFTAEQLVAMSSTKKLGMGGGELVEKAKAYLEQASGSVEMDAMRARIAELEAMVQGNATPAQNDAFAGFSDDDLRNMITDATGEAPHGRTGRAKLIETLDAIEAAKAAELAAA